MVESYQEVSDDNVAPRPQHWGKAALAVGAACALLLVGFATGSHFWSSQAFSKEVAPLGLNAIQTIPPREQCAKTNANCAAQKCCKMTGFRCFEKTPGDAKCMKKCVPGQDGTCNELARPMVASSKSEVSQTSNTFFCWAFYTDNTGTTKPIYELDLMRTQLFLGASIFGCETWKVYSDVETWISPADDKDPSKQGVNTVKVIDVDNNFHFDKRKKCGKWVNSNMFIQAWKKIQEEGQWNLRDWTVKADIDAIFLPSRLRKYLENVEVTEKGVYLETCKYVNYGFFGSLAVVSRNAARTYIANIDDCKTALNYMGKEKATGNQPWGEDLFQQRCMDLHQVDKIAAYDLNTDVSCEMWRPEGQKKNLKWKPDCSIINTPGIHHFGVPKEYFDCLKATQGQ